MVQAIKRTMNRTISVPERVGPTSLNKTRRKQEVRDITNSNLRLLGRLESAKSDYAVRELEKRFEKTQRYSLNASFSLRKKCEEVVREFNSQVKVE